MSSIPYLSAVGSLMYLAIGTHPDIAFAVGLLSQCRQDNNLPHESFVESDSRARMSYHNHPKPHLHSIT